MGILTPVPRPHGLVDGLAGGEAAAGSILHVLVGGRPAAPGRIRFRRDRFAEFLGAQPTTAGVFVLEPANRQRAAVRVQLAERLPIRYFGLHDYRNLLSYGGWLLRPRHAPVLRQVRRSEASQRILWYTKPIYPELVDALEWDAVVYDCSDFWTGHRSHRNPIARWNAPRQSRAEARIIAGSDLLLASSSALAERMRAEFGREALLVENGVDFDLFAAPAGEPPADIADLPRPRLGFVGAMKGHKIDFALLYAVALAHPGWSFVLVGPDEASTHRDGDFARLCSLPSVRWLGPRSGAEVPRYLQALDVGLLPYRDAEYNRGVFPLKFFEYLAAGLPVVGCGLPSTLSYVEDGVYRHVGARTEEFSDACAVALHENHHLEGRRAIARGADWNAKFRSMLEAALQSTRHLPSEAQP